MGRPRADLRGDVFGKLVAISFAEIRGHGDAYWNCICDCGNTKVVSALHLKRGSTTSCGCGQGGNTHGLASHPLYQTWKKMLRRCYVKTDSSYYNYGARGITVSPEWFNLERFVHDMSDRPAGTTLDRIDSNGPYSKDNCRWATALEQRHNRRDNLVVKTSVDPSNKTPDSTCNNANLG